MNKLFNKTPSGTDDMVQEVAQYKDVIKDVVDISSSFNVNLDGLSLKNMDIFGTGKKFIDDYKDGLKNITDNSLSFNFSLKDISLKNIDLLGAGKNVVDNYLTPFANGLQNGMNMAQKMGIDVSGLSPVLDTVNAAISGYNTLAGLAGTITETMTTAQELWNIAISASPLGMIILAVGALVAIIAVAWNKFDGFRGMVMGVWESLKAFGSLIKDLVIDRIKELLSGLTGMGKALYLLFTGNFKEAFETGKQAIQSFAGADKTAKIVDGVQKIKDAYSKGYDSVAKKIVPPEHASDHNKKANTNEPQKGPQDDNKNTAASIQPHTDAVTNGGNRNITINLGKFFDNIIIHSQTLKEGVSEMEQDVEKALLRILYSATSLQQD